MGRQQGLRALTLFLPLALAVTVLGYLVGSRLLLLAAGGLIAVPLITLTTRRPPLLDVSLPEISRVSVGETLTHQVTFTNNSGARFPAGQVQLTTAGLDDAVLWCPALVPGQTAIAYVERTALQRGIADHSHLHLLASDPFDLRSRQRCLNVEHRTIVHPNRAVSARLPLAGVGGEVGAVSADDGTDVAGVRQWARGDSQRAVHWRATARTGRLVVADRRDPLGRSLKAVVLGDRLGASAEQALAVVVASAADVLAAGGDVRLLWVGSAGIVQAPTASRGALADWAARIGPAPGGDTAQGPTAHGHNAQGNAPAGVLPGAVTAALPDPSAVAGRLRPGRAGDSSAQVWVVVADHLPVEWLRALDAHLQCIDPLTTQPLELPR